jgi:hypothetical protein
MPKWKISVSFWEVEVEADDEGDALMEADSIFNFMNEARVEELEPEEE